MPTGDAIMVNGEPVSRGGEALGASASSACCCGQGPCGAGQPSCCITNPRPPGCVPYLPGQATVFRWLNGVFSNQVFGPPEPNCCCGPASGRTYTIEHEETVWWSTGYPELLSLRGHVRANAVGRPDANGRIPYTRTTTFGGTTTNGAGTTRVVTLAQECAANQGYEWGQFPQPGFGFPTCWSAHLVGEPGGQGQYSCVPKDGYRFFDCYTEILDLWSEIRLTTVSGTIVQGVSHAKYRLTVSPNNSTCVTPCPPRGACCCGGLCFQSTQAECAAMNGQYKGNGVGCYGVDCTPQGRCCLPNGLCEDTDRARCYLLGGQWGPAGTSCERNPCPTTPEVAACCLPSQVCSPLTQVQCLAQGGTWYPGLQCQQVICTVVSTGACCLPDGSCAQITVGACAAQQGWWNGEGSNCGSTICATGACCADFTQQGQTVRECFQSTAENCALNVNPVFYGYGSLCTPGLCGESRRASGSRGFFLDGLQYLYERAPRRSRDSAGAVHHLPLVHLRRARHRAVGRHRRDLHRRWAVRRNALHVMPPVLPGREAPGPERDGAVHGHRVVRRARVPALAVGVQADRQRARLRLCARSQGPVVAI